MTREDERKLWEAYKTLDKLINTPHKTLKLEEVEEIVEEFRKTVALMLGEIPMKPFYRAQALSFFDKYCDDFIKNKKKKL